MANPPGNSHGKIARLAAFFDRARFLFIPLAMCALLAVGAHASADALGDLFLEWIDRAQGLFDSIVSRWSVTAPLVDLIGLTRRTALARVVALLFELAADVLLAFPMLGFDERPDLTVRARALFVKSANRPTLIAYTRFLFACALGLAGAASVARLVHGAIALELRPLFGKSGLGAPRLFGLVALAWLIFAIASRAALRALEQADEKSLAATTVRARWLLGLTGSLVLAPLALEAIFHAAPLGSFLR